MSLFVLISKIIAAYSYKKILYNNNFMACLDNFYKVACFINFTTTVIFEWAIFGKYF